MKPIIYFTILLVAIVSASRIPSYLPGGKLPECRETFCEEIYKFYNACITPPETNDPSCYCSRCSWDKEKNVCVAANTSAELICLYGRGIFAILVWILAIVGEFIMVTIIIYGIYKTGGSSMQRPVEEFKKILPWVPLTFFGIFSSFISRGTVQEKLYVDVLNVVGMLESPHLILIIFYSRHVAMSWKFMAIIVHLICSLGWIIASCPYPNIISNGTSMSLEYASIGLYLLFVSSHLGRKDISDGDSKTMVKNWCSMDTLRSVWFFRDIIVATIFSVCLITYNFPDNTSWSLFIPNLLLDGVVLIIILIDTMIAFGNS